MIPRFCHQFANIYQCPWPPSTLLHFARSRLEVPTTSSKFPFEGVPGTHKLDVPTLCTKTFDSFVVMSLTIALIFTLNPSISLIAITISFTFQLLRVTDCGLQWLLYCHSQMHDLLAQACNIIFLFCLS